VPNRHLIHRDRRLETPGKQGVGQGARTRRPAFLLYNKCIGLFCRKNFKNGSKSFVYKKRYVLLQRYFVSELFLLT
jgi:hypothetical protein